MRIAILVVVAAAAALTIGRVLWLRRGGGGRERWLAHDQALVLFESGKHAEAAAVYRRLLDENPDDRVARFNLGLCLVRTGDASGWAEIEAVAAADPGFDDAQIALADRAVEQGDVVGAVERLQLAIERPPEPAGARARLAELLLSLGDRRPEAMRQLAAVVASDRDPPAVRAAAAIRLAREHGRQADLHRSPAAERQNEQRAYQLAIQLTEQGGVLDRPPEDWDAETTALGALRPFALAAVGRQEEALGAVDIALRAPVDPGTRAGLLVLRAQLYWLEGDATRAESELAAALSGGGDLSPQLFLAASDLYESRGHRDRAAGVLQAGLELHPEEERLRISLARILFLTGKADEAEKVLCVDGAIPESDAALLFLGDLRRYRGERLEARRAYELLKERRPRRRDVALRLASMDAQTAFESGAVEPGAFRTLEDAAREALDREPDDAEARLALARVRLLRLAHPPAGASVDAELTSIRDDLKRAIDADPLLFEAHVLLAHVQARLGAFDESAVILERVLEALPNERPFLRVLLSEAYLGLGAPARALEEARRAVEGLRDDPRALRALVAAATFAGDGSAAIDALQRLIVVQPDAIAHRRELAVLLARKGDVAGADAVFAEAERIASEIADEDDRAAALRGITEARAVSYMRLGNVDRARGAYTALLERYPNAVEARVAYGRFLRGIGSEDEAERAFQDALVGSPDALIPRRALLDLWADRGELTPRLADLVRRMREIAGDDPQVLYAEGRLAALQGDLRVALDKLQACAAGLPSDADAQFALGVVLSQSGRLDEAVDSLQRAVGLAPRSARARDALARARFALARELARMGRLRAARELLEGAVDDDPDAAAPRQALAGLLGMTMGVEASEAEIREMLARDPHDVVLRQMLAAALVQKEDLAGATRELMRVAEDLADDWTVWSSLSLVRLRMKDIEGAARWAARAREAAPDDPRSLAPTLQVLAAQGRDDQARAILDQAIAASPDEPHYLLLRAILNARGNRFEDVVSDATGALEMAPAMTRAAHLAVYALRYGLGSPERAQEFVQACADRAPEVPEYTFLLGWLASDRGDGSAAVEILRPLAEHDPPHQPALESVALLLMRGGDTAGARELLERGLAVNPENPNFHYLRAQSLLRDAQAEGDPEVQGPTRGVVIAALERTLELAPRHHTARNNLAYVLAADPERLPDALEHARRATEEAPRNAPYVDTLGVVQLRMGRVDDARQSFERGLAIVRESKAVLDSAGAAVTVSEPGRADRLRRRLERQEAELRRHLDEALQRSRRE